MGRCELAVGFSVEAIAGQSAATRAGLLALNNDHAQELSLLDAARWEVLVTRAFCATCVGGDALLIAFDQDADYDSKHFHWLKARRERFVYVDRVCVAAAVRGGGVARRLYEDLFAKAVAAGHDRVLCEVNAVPPNPGSDAFHARMGFAAFDRKAWSETGRTVRYMEKLLGG